MLVLEARSRLEKYMKCQKTHGISSCECLLPQIIATGFLPLYRSLIG